MYIFFKNNVVGRHLYTGGRQSKQGYGQVTCIISSRREEYEINRKGVRVPMTMSSNTSSTTASSSSNSTMSVIFDNESICVFEVSFSDPKHRWRLGMIIEEERSYDKDKSQISSSSGLGVAGSNLML